MSHCGLLNSDANVSINMWRYNSITVHCVSFSVFS